MNWLNKNFPPDTRYHSAIVKGDNVLTPEAVRTVWDIMKRVSSVQVNCRVTEIIQIYIVTANYRVFL